jgi:murein DD-endopeptidase MepM/ murein hydrolase activator NlpD
MHDKKIFLILIMCGCISACGRTSPAPVRWGGQAKSRRAYLQGSQSQQQNTPTKYKTKAKPKTEGSIVVKRGDTAYSISRDNNVPLRTLIETNNLKAPYQLEIGQNLLLPSARYYIVKKDDTLYSIAKNNNISLSSLTNLNTINPPYTISVGQKLALPYEKSTISITKTDYKTPKITKSIPKRSSSKFSKPVKGKVISGFGPKKNGLHNDGINIAAKKGTPVKAAENGLIVYSSNKIKGLGNIILVKHDGDWVTTYAHLDKPLAKKGQKVYKGTTIGTVGETGSVNSPQLHFEIRKRTKPVDPSKYF